MLVEKSYYKKDASDVIIDLKSTGKGISENEAVKRREAYGLNELPRFKGTSIIKLFLEQFKDILILILIIAIIINLAVILIEQEYSLEKFTDVIAITIFIMINSIVGLVTEYRSEKSVTA